MHTWEACSFMLVCHATAPADVKAAQLFYDDMFA